MLNIFEVENFNNVNDPVKTEETIYNQLHHRKEKISSDYVYVAMPIAWHINTKGIIQTQQVIDEVCKKLKGKKLFFVCQHIQVSNLNFNGHMVFTPHATIMDNYLPIPHFSCNYDVSMIKPWSERQYLFSFVGSFATHPVRKKIYDVIKERKDCYVLDTGGWHFESSVERQKENKQRYIEILGNTKYSLCPRGTGPSTIRIWEAMAMNSCPVIISDFLKMPSKLPLENKNWHKLAEKFQDLQVNSPPYDNKEYWDWFSNDNLYKSITSFLT